MQQMACYTEPSEQSPLVTVWKRTVFKKYFAGDSMNHLFMIGQRQPIRLAEPDGDSKSSWRKTENIFSIKKSCQFCYFFFLQ